MSFRSEVRRVEFILKCGAGHIRYGLHGEILPEFRKWAILTLVLRRRWKIDNPTKREEYEDRWALQWMWTGHPDPMLWLYPDHVREGRIRRFRSGE